jgi:hypothetical protein
MAHYGSRPAAWSTNEGDDGNPINNESQEYDILKLPTNIVQRDMLLYIVRPYEEHLDAEAQFNICHFHIISNRYRRFSYRPMVITGCAINVKLMVFMTTNIWERSSGTLTVSSVATVVTDAFHKNWIMSQRNWLKL